jgi:hypothetical protein
MTALQFELLWLQNDDERLNFPWYAIFQYLVFKNKGLK